MTDQAKEPLAEAEVEFERPRAFIELDYHVEEDGSTLPVLWFFFRDDVVAVPAEKQHAEEIVELLLEMLDEPCSKLVYEASDEKLIPAEHSEAEA